MSVGIAAVVVVSLVLWGINTSSDSPSAASQAVSALQTAVTAPDFQAAMEQKYDVAFRRLQTER